MRLTGVGSVGWSDPLVSPPNCTNMSHPQCFTDTPRLWMRAMKRCPPITTLYVAGGERTGAAGDREGRRGDALQPQLPRVRHSLPRRHSHRRRHQSSQPTLHRGYINSQRSLMSALWNSDNVFWKSCFDQVKCIQNLSGNSYMDFVTGQSEHRCSDFCAHPGELTQALTHARSKLLVTVDDLLPVAKEAANKAPEVKVRSSMITSFRWGPHGPTSASGIRVFSPVESLLSRQLQSWMRVKLLPSACLP